MRRATEKIAETIKAGKKPNRRRPRLIDLNSLLWEELPEEERIALAWQRMERLGISAYDGFGHPIGGDLSGHRIPW